MFQYKYIIKKLFCVGHGYLFVGDSVEDMCICILIYV